MLNKIRKVFYEKFIDKLILLWYNNGGNSGMDCTPFVYNAVQNTICINKWIF